MPDRLQEIRARLDAATPGPWEYHPDPVGALAGPDGRNIITPYAGYGNASDWPDITLIAHAPADIAFLLSENEALREQIGFLHEDSGESRLVVKSPQERVWEVWRTTRDRKVATFRTKREATEYVEGGGDE